MRLIDADALEEALTEHFNTGRYNNHTVLGYIDAAPTVQREGWVSVPIEPTEEMLKAAQSEQGDHGSYKEWLDYGYGEDVIATYKAMIQAAPKE